MKNKKTKKQSRCADVSVCNNCTRRFAFQLIHFASGVWMSHLAVRLLPGVSSLFHRDRLHVRHSVKINSIKKKISEDGSSIPRHWCFVSLETVTDLASNNDYHTVCLMTFEGLKCHWTSGKALIQGFLVCSTKCGDEVYFLWWQVGECLEARRGGDKWSRPEGTVWRFFSFSLFVKKIVMFTLNPVLFKSTVSLSCLCWCTEAYLSMFPPPVDEQSSRAEQSVVLLDVYNTTGNISVKR